MTNQPKYESVPGIGIRLIEDFPIRYENGSTEGILCVVPKGYVSDGASIPWIAWQLTYTPFDDLVIASAVAHDWGDDIHFLTFKQNNKMFKQMLTENGANKLKIKIMYWSVSVAKWTWKRKKEDEDYLIKLYNEVKDRPNIDEYKFPQSIIDKAN